MTHDARESGSPGSQPTAGDHMRSTCDGDERDEVIIGGAVVGGIVGHPSCTQPARLPCGGLVEDPHRLPPDERGARGR